MEARLLRLPGSVKASVLFGQGVVMGIPFEWRLRSARAELMPESRWQAVPRHRARDRDRRLRFEASSRKCPTRRRGCRRLAAQHLPCLLLGQIRAEVAHVVGAPDNRGFVVITQKGVDVV